MDQNGFSAVDFLFSDRLLNPVRVTSFALWCFLDLAFQIQVKHFLLRKKIGVTKTDLDILINEFENVIRCTRLIQANCLNASFYLVYTIKNIEPSTT
jgi:hypothetical protein